jgi:hypothetical protein
MGKYLNKQYVAGVMFFCICIFTFAPYVAWAQTPNATATPQGQTTTIPSNPNTQGARVVSGPSGTQSNTQGNKAEAELGADAVGCGVGKVLANIVQAGISAVVGSIKSSATGAASNVATGVTEQAVPVADNSVRNNTGDVNNKETGNGQKGVVDAVTGIFSIGWDAIGFCLANAAIHYVAQSTINWINSGFEGNPVFIDNPGQFFRDVADAEAGLFIEELGLGFLCSEFAPKVRIALVNDYVKRTGGNYDNIKCTFTDAQKNLEGFMSDFRQGGLGNYVEFVSNPGNRAQSAYLASQDALTFKINQQKAQLDMELNWGRGILSIKECPETVVNGKKVKDTKNCVTKTPGQVIQGQIESTLNLPKDRLTIADEFDEVVVALVNYLIKTALSESLTNDTRGGQFGTSNNGDSDEDDEPQPSFPGQNPGTSIPDVTVNPNQPRPLRLTCEASTTTAKVDENITFTATPNGLSSTNFAFDWLGDPSFPTSTPDRSLTIFYDAAGTSSVSVRVRNGNRTASTSCPVVTITPATPITASCNPDRTRAVTGETVVWSAVASGGNGTYSYLWRGDDGLAGQTVREPAISYASRGTKDGEVTIASGSQSIKVICPNDVRVSRP